eukprot:scaffold2242_cov83-Phaeocystis_antarctica.AAC.1
MAGAHATAGGAWPGFHMGARGGSADGRDGQSHAGERECTRARGGDGEDGDHVLDNGMEADAEGAHTGGVQPQARDAGAWRGRHRGSGAQ